MILGNAHGWSMPAPILSNGALTAAQSRDGGDGRAGGIRGALKALPLLPSAVRKKVAKPSSATTYLRQREAARSELVDVIDIELFNDEAQIRALVDVCMPRASR